MKIASATVALEGRHVSASRHEERETLLTWVGQERPDFEGSPPGMRPAPSAAVVDISVAGKSAQSADATAIEQAGDAAQTSPFLRLIMAMVEWLTGRPVRIFDASQLRGGAASPVAAADGHRAEPPQRAGFGVEYDYHAVHEEFEQADFSAQGTIKTADGQDIAFALELSMSRHFRAETNTSFRAGDGIRKDPLVLNFAGTAAQLSNQRFRFDLDGDGASEEVPLLAGGSGYLALDLNMNGKIDSGAELFGPNSGSGFGDLARYDTDANGWIDDNDEVFDDLLLWTPSTEDAGIVTSLKAHGVGALYLGAAATAFELRDEANRDLGAVRDTGLYLTENGQAGTLQEIDLTI